jgi:two-component system, NarL family, response regulator NreC
MSSPRVRILLADDHDMVRAGIRSVLATQPDLEVVAEADDGDAAVIAAGAHRPDVAILDITMPGRNGVAATKEILGLGHGTRIIALSMHCDRQFITAMLSAGASGYLLKNTAERELIPAIRAVLAGETWLSPQATEVLASTCADGEALLTDREREVLALLANGKSSKEIADSLFISARTVETYRAQIMDKLDIRTIAGLTKYAVRHGLTTMQ